MERISLQEIMEVTRGDMISGCRDHFITGVSTDSRTASENDLFIPIIGENHDGHQFLKSAFDNGCRAFMISEKEAASQIPEADTILVSDTLRAMQDLAYHYLESLGLHKVAVTGSVGKTSTRDMIYYILSQKYRTARPEKNYNNEIGVPLTIFSLDKTYEAAVFEEGLEYAGDIHRLSRMTRPDLAVITNIGVSHIENLGTRENIFKAKLEVADFLPQDGALIINSDSDFLKKENIDKEYRIISCGHDPSFDYYVHDIIDRGTDGITFTLTTKDEEAVINLPVPGAHNAVNAALAASVAAELGIGLGDVQKGLSKLELTGKRLLVKEGLGRKVIDDSYNAAPASMKSAVDTLMNTKGKRHVAVLAGMNELGEDWKKYHMEVGEYCTEKRLDMVIGVGDKARAIVEGAQGSDTTYSVWFPDKESFYSEMDDMIKAGDVIIVKGSNAYKMSEVADRLVGRRDQ